MDQRIKDRFKQQEESWDFTTFIDGKLHSHNEAMENLKKEMDEQDAKIKEKEEQEKLENSPVEPEVVSEILSEEYGTNQEATATRHVFGGMEEYNSWYLSNQDRFTEAQQKPSDSIVKLQEWSSKGCACNRDKRRAFARVEWRRLMLENYEKTDLIEVIRQITGKDEVEFKLGEDSFIVHSK